MKTQYKVLTGVGAILLIGGVTMFVELGFIKKYAAAAGVSGNKIAIGVVIGFICMVEVAIIASIMVMKLLEKHVKNLTDYSKMLAEGKLDFEVKAPCNDEFSKVYEAFAEIIDNGKENAKVADSIADGNLAVDYLARSSEDIMGNALTKLLDNNNEVLSGISRATGNLSQGAEQVAAASQSLAQGSTEQAAAIEEITVSMKDIERMTADNAEYANSANSIVVETKNSANLGNTRMHEMKTAMNEINASSDKISKIIKVIDDISFQTNILALNAAVEAARAGVHGKGFAVVAEQIRELAGKSADAAAETAEMIDDSIKKVHNGNRLADETECALNEIVNNIDNVADITDKIYNASNQQAVAVAQIDKAIEQVSTVVQNNSATSEECAAAAEELSGQSASLNEMMSCYTLRDVSGTGKSFNKKYAGNKKNDSRIATNTDSGKVDPETIISLDGDFGKY